MKDILKMEITNISLEDITLEIDDEKDKILDLYANCIPCMLVYGLGASACGVVANLVYGSEFSINCIIACFFTGMFLAVGQIGYKVLVIKNKIKNLKELEGRKKLSESLSKEQ